MVFTSSILSVLILFFAGLNSFAQNPALKMIDTADLKRHLSFLSSDSLQGRRLGTPLPGLDMAAGYIKVNIEKTGLASGAEDYFQKFSIISSQPDIENSFFRR